MLALVTGGTGFIGSHLVEKLLQKGYAVRCLVRPTSNLIWLKNLDIEFVYGDFFHEDSLKQALDNVEYIFHAAGVTKARTKQEYFLINTEATARLLRAAWKSNPSIKKFVHISSLAAVGPSLDGKPVNEETSRHPINTYGKSKMQAELECLAYQDKLPITIIRPPAVYGQRDRDFLKFFRCVEYGILPIVSSSEAKLSLVHISDLVSGILLATEMGNATNQTYFIADENFYTWRELGGIAAEQFRKKIHTLYIPPWALYTVAFAVETVSAFQRKATLFNREKAKEALQEYWICDVGKAKQELGFQSQISIEKGIQQTIAWYRDKGWLRKFNS